MTDTDVQSDSEYGLKEDWVSVQKTLEEIIPVYDKTNRYISLGSDLKIRKRGIALLKEHVGKDDFLLLDLGAGTGKMTSLFVQNSGKVEDAVLVDPIRGMMRVAKSRTRAVGVLAVYEQLPFRSGSLDAAMAGFSLRDARDLTKALAELQRTLKGGGHFLIVDLSKPNSKTKSGLLSFYWRAIAPLLAFIASGRSGLKFAALATTYDRLPKVSSLLKLFENSGFSVPVAEFSMLGGVCIIILRKNG